MTDAPQRIGLGTAQFGLDYGVTNPGGRVPEAEVAAILDLASVEGIETLDTAFLYGESEAVIGRLGGAERFRVVTKTPKFIATAAPSELLRSSFQASLKRLRAKRVYGLLFHDTRDLIGSSGAELWRSAEAMKSAGLVQKIGISVYDSAEVDAALALYPIDLVQLPWSPLDRRMSDDGLLDRLASSGVEVHARSLFLQGLLLQDPSSIPPSFRPIAEAVAHLQTYFAAAGLNPLEGVLASALREQRISRFVCGVTSAAELCTLIAAAAVASRRRDFVPPIVATLEAIYLNPARWPELGVEASQR